MSTEHQPLTKFEIDRAQEAKKVFSSRLHNLKIIYKKLEPAKLLADVFPGLEKTKSVTEEPYTLQTTHNSNFLITAFVVNPVSYRVTVTVIESDSNEASQKIAGVERTKGIELAYMDPYCADMNLSFGNLDIPGDFHTSVHQFKDFLAQDNIEVLQTQIKARLQRAGTSVQS